MEVFANLATATVTSGGTTAPVAGTTETWTISGSTFPAVSNAAVPPTTLHVVEDSVSRQTEIILVTNISGATWSVTRGAEGTTPVAHPAGFTIVQVPTALVMNNLMSLSGIYLEAIIVSGAASVASNVMKPGIRVPVACTAYTLYAWCDTAPTGAGLVVTVKKNGTSIGTVTIAASATSGSNNITPVALAKGDLLTFDVTQVGSTVAGSDVGCQIEAY